jgi:antitoxin component of RelBE/YafQ-DinJ toxin-antitoxin module
MANTFPKRWTEAFQMRVAPEFLEKLDRISAGLGLTRSEAIRMLVDEADAKLETKAKRSR